MILLPHGDWTRMVTVACGMVISESVHIDDDGGLSTSSGHLVLRKYLGWTWMAVGGAGAIRTGLFLVCCSCCCVEVGRRVRILGDFIEAGCDDEAGETGGWGVGSTRAFAGIALVVGALLVLLLLWAFEVVEVDTAAVLLAFRSRSAMASWIARSSWGFNFRLLIKSLELKICHLKCN